jgi:hypothetical protein
LGLLVSRCSEVSLLLVGHDLDPSLEAPDGLLEVVVGRRLGRISREG